MSSLLCSHCGRSLPSAREAGAGPALCADCAAALAPGAPDPFDRVAEAALPPDALAPGEPPSPLPGDGDAGPGDEGGVDLRTLAEEERAITRESHLRPGRAAVWGLILGCGLGAILDLWGISGRSPEKTHGLNLCGLFVVCLLMGGVGALFAAVTVGWLRLLVQMYYDRQANLLDEEEVARRLAELEARRRREVLEQAVPREDERVGPAAASEFGRAVVALLASVRQPYAVRTGSADAREVLEIAHVELSRACRVATVSELDQALHALVEAIPSADLQNAAELAGACAMLAERGGRYPAAASAVLARLREAFAELARMPPGLDPEQALEARLVTDQTRLSEGFSKAGPGGRPLREAAGWSAGREVSPALAAWLALPALQAAATTILCLDRDARLAATQDGALRAAAAAAAAVDPAVESFTALLATVVEAELLVLHPGQGRGFRVAVENVRNNYQLFTLLQAELCPRGLDATFIQGPAYGDDIAAVARGEMTAEDFVSGTRPGAPGTRGSSAWAYCQWTALRPDGALAPESDEVPATGTPADILPFEDVRPVLLGPRQEPLSWDVYLVSPVHRALRPALRVVEELPRADVAAWLRRLAKGFAG